MKTLPLVLISWMMSFPLLAQDVGYELTCRAKAKEVAAETYKNCVTENRSAQLEQVRKDYQQRLKLLKEDYEKDLQKLSGKKPDNTSTLLKLDVKTETTKPEVKPNPTKTANKVVARNSRGSMPAKKVTEKSSDDMSIQMKAVTTAPMTDDSVMDLPEPIPVENIPSESSL